MLTAERLRELLDYDAETGVFRWKIEKRGGPRGKVRVGDVAGSVGGEGYRNIVFDGKKFLAHRLAWLHVTGEWPKNEVDHRNLARDDNRFSNLRCATRQQNSWNAPAHSDNRCGFKGVTVSRGLYQAQIGINGKHKNLGRFSTPEAAHEAYVAAAIRSRGDFVRTE